MTNEDFITLHVRARDRERWQRDDLFRRRIIGTYAREAHRQHPGRRITLQVIGLGIGITFYELHGGKAVLREE
jgi:hypothetical protein